MPIDRGSFLAVVNTFSVMIAQFRRGNNDSLNFGGIPDQNQLLVWSSKRSVYPGSIFMTTIKIPVNVLF